MMALDAKQLGLERQSRCGNDPLVDSEADAADDDGHEHGAMLRSKGLRRYQETCNIRKRSSPHF